MTDGPSDDDARCSFCGRPQNEVVHLVQGPRAAICDACVLTARRTIWRRVSPQYLVRLLHPGLSEAWASYLGLLVTVPAVAVLAEVASAARRLDGALRGGLRGGSILLIAVAAALVCSYVLMMIFADLANQQFVTRLLAGTSWGVAAWSFSPEPSTYSVLSIVVACAVSQIVVSVRPKTAKGS